MTTLTIDKVSLYAGLFVIGLGGLVLWQFYSLNKDPPRLLQREDRHFRFALSFLVLQLAARGAMLASGRSAAKRSNGAICL